MKHRSVLRIGAAMATGVLAFAATYFGLFTVVALPDPTAVAEMFRAPFVQAALFLALFMLTDPPTSPSRYWDQIAIGAVAAAVACAAQLLGAGQAYLLLGVLAGNLVLAARRWMSSRTTDATRRVAKTGRTAPRVA